MVLLEESCESVVSPYILTVDILFRKHSFISEGSEKKQSLERWGVHGGPPLSHGLQILLRS